MSKILIVYYSWSNGNTKRIAELLQKETKADIFEIETVEPYTGSYDEVVSQGQEEVNRGFEPPIKDLDVDLSAYDIIAVGTPTWWYTMAPAVLTFLNSHDWTGKKVVPFMTNGGWPGHVIRDMKNACRKADSYCELEIKFDSQGGANLETKESIITDWINEVKKLMETT